MFLLTQQRTQNGTNDLDADDGDHAVGYGDDGLHEQLLRKLNRSNKVAGIVKSKSRPAAVDSSKLQAQHAGQHVVPRTLPAALTQYAAGSQSHSSPPPSREGGRPAVHDLLGDLLTQAGVGQADQHCDLQQGQLEGSQHAQDVCQDMQGFEGSPPQQQHEPEQQLPASAAGVVASHRQLLANLLQPGPQHQQPHVMESAALQPPPAPATAKQQKHKSILYSTKSATHSTASTPVGRAASTPQQQKKASAAKKKPRFSIKDTPTQPTPSAFVTPQRKGQGHPAAAAAAGGDGGVDAGIGSSARTLAGLLGGSGATPSRRPGSTSLSRTPLQHSSAAGLAAFFATPKRSNSKAPQQHTADAALSGAQTTPPVSAVTGGGVSSAVAAAGAATALFDDGASALRTPAAAAAGADAVTPHTAGGSSSGKGSKRRASDVNPLEELSAARQRQRAFLDSLPTGPAWAGPGLAGLQLGGVSVPLGSNLVKVWQQLQDVRKKQQDRLEESPDQDTGALELEVHSKVYEAHLVKCSCTVTQCPPPAQQQQQQLTQRPGLAAGSAQQQQQQVQVQVQAQQPRVGDQVFALVNSKASHAVDLRAGSRFKLHTPWHVMAPAQPGKPLVVLGYFLS